MNRINIKRVLLAFAVGFGVFAGVYFGLSYASAASTPNAEFVGVAAAQDDVIEDEDEQEIPPDAILAPENERWYIANIESRDGEIAVTVVSVTDGSVSVSYADVSSQVTGENNQASFVASETTRIDDEQTISVSASSSERGQIGLITIEGNNVLLEGEPAPGGGLLDVIDSTTAFIIGTFGGTMAVALYLYKKSDNDFNAPLKDDEAYKKSFK